MGYSEVKLCYGPSETKFLTNGSFTVYFAALASILSFNWNLESYIYPLMLQFGATQDQVIVHPTDSIDCTGDDYIAHDPDLFPEGHNEQYDPYEYGSDYEPMDTMSDHSESPHENEEISHDAQASTEEQWYYEWASNTFDLRGTDRQEYIGYYDNPTTGYSIDAISPEETRGCRTAQFMVHKNIQSGEGQPDELREPWEATESWTRFGICDGTPSRDFHFPTVWPARGAQEDIQSDNVDWNPQNETPNHIAMLFHPWCFDIFCRQSKIQFKRVNVAGLMAWRNAGIDWDSSHSLHRFDDVENSRKQWWHHKPGSEYLVANPLYVPRLPPILLDRVEDAEHSSPSTTNEKPEPSHLWLLVECY